MVQIAICHLLVGAVFGLRFRVLVLLPLTLASTVMTAVIGLMMDQSALAVGTHIAVLALALQGGYLFGSLARFTIAAARASRRVPATSSVETAH